MCVKIQDVFISILLLFLLVISAHIYVFVI